MKLSKKKQVALHKRDMALRKQKPKTFGRIKESFKTKSGKTIRNQKPTRLEDGRPVFSTATKARVFDHDGNPLVVTIRIAASLMSDGQIPIQEIAALR